MARMAQDAAAAILALLDRVEETIPKLSGPDDLRRALVAR